MTVTRLVGVYNADGGLAGELRYLIGHYLGGRSCSLCDVTHSPLRRKAAWDEQVAALGIPFDLLHLNELDPEISAFVEGKAACVAAETSEGRMILLDNAQITSADGDVAAFFAILRERLDSLA